MKSPKYIVFIDHLADYNHRDIYVALDGNTIMDAIKSFDKKFNVYFLYDRVYLYKLMQRTGNNTYKDILLNRGHGWNVEDNPLDSTVYSCQIKSVDKYEED